MYGSDKVFKAFNTWLLATKEDNNKEQFSAFLDLILEIRKDLCNGKTNLTKHDILLNLTQSEEEARKLLIDFSMTTISQQQYIAKWHDGFVGYIGSLSSVVEG